MSRNTKSPSQLQRLNHSNKGTVAKVLLATAVIAGTIVASTGIIATSKAPSDGPLPKVTQTRNQHGEISSAVNEKIR